MESIQASGAASAPGFFVSRRISVISAIRGKNHRKLTTDHTDGTDKILRIRGAEAAWRAKVFVTKSPYLSASLRR